MKNEARGPAGCYRGGSQCLRGGEHVEQKPSCLASVLVLSEEEQARGIGLQDVRPLESEPLPR